MTGRSILDTPGSDPSPRTRESEQDYRWRIRCRQGPDDIRPPRDPHALGFLDVPPDATKEALSEVAAAEDRFIKEGIEGLERGERERLERRQEFMRAAETIERHAPLPTHRRDHDVSVLDQSHPHAGVEPDPNAVDWEKPEWRVDWDALTLKSHGIQPYVPYWGKVTLD